MIDRLHAGVRWMLTETAGFVLATFGVGFAIALTYQRSVADALNEYVSDGGSLYLIVSLAMLTVGFIACFLAMRWMEASGVSRIASRVIGAVLCAVLVCCALGPMLPPLALASAVIAGDGIMLSAELGSVRPA